MNFKAVIFDVDGTLTGYHSWQKITIELGASIDKHMEYFDKMLAGELSYPQARDLLVKEWQSTGKANYVNFKKIFASWKVKKSAQVLISTLRRKYMICLISGSMDLYVETIAQKLKIDNWYANTKLIWDETLNLKTFVYEINQVTKKVTQFKHFLKQNNLRNNECIVIGDGDSDIGLFKTATYSIAIIPGKNPELLKLATWKVNDLNAIKSILV